MDARQLCRYFLAENSSVVSLKLICAKFFFFSCGGNAKLQLPCFSIAFVLGDRMAFPNFFIIGTAKAGTTSLYQYLSQHPDVFMSPVKEPHYFTQVASDAAMRFTYAYKSVQDETSYRKLFRGASQQRALGEASTSYLWDEKVPARIKAVVPEAKIIAMLREPVARAFSHYLNTLREGMESRPFLQALKEDHAKPRKGWGVSHLYVELGLYAEQVQRYFASFAEKNVLILFFEEFSADTNSALRQVWDFLELTPPPSGADEYQVVHNPYLAPRSVVSQTILGTPALRAMGRMLPKPLREFGRDRLLFRREKKPALDPAARDFLRGIYEPDRTRLAEMMKRNQPWK